MTEAPPQQKSPGLLRVNPGRRGTKSTSSSKQTTKISSSSSSWCSSTNICNSDGIAIEVVPTIVSANSAVATPVRIVMMGDHRTGVTSLLRRFNLGLYGVEYRPERGKIMRHTKSVFHHGHGFYVTVQFWDVEGSDLRTAFQCALKAHAVAVVFDITNRTSFENAQKYFQCVNPRACALLVGNKVDLRENRKVSFEEGRLLARIHRVEYMETSSKLNYNVDEAFHYLVTCVPDQFLLSYQKNSTLPKRAMNRTTLCAICRRRLRRHHDDPKYAEGAGSTRDHSSGPEECPEVFEDIRYERKGLVRYQSTSESVNYHSTNDSEDSLYPERIRHGRTRLSTA